MNAMLRNQLVWLDPQGWAQVQAHGWDAEAQTILAHWHRHDLPLVVCRQRGDIETGQLCLGLPAPPQWSRRRLALTVGRDQVATIGDFPTLQQVAQAHAWGPDALALLQALTQLGVMARVYGSHGWQLMTRMPYLHAASDIDVSLPVPDFQTACKAAALLSAAEFGPRLDGEIVFPGDQAVAWRELQQLRAGQVVQVLMKSLGSVGLVSADHLRGIGVEVLP